MGGNVVTTPIIYLASPYTHDDPIIRESRYLLAVRATAFLIRQECIVFSPIVHSHPVAVHLDGDAMVSAYWTQYNEPFMDMCSKMVVLQIAGWEGSRGVQREIAYFVKHNKPIRYLTPFELSGQYRWSPTVDSTPRKEHYP